jgi:hypothetical protein
LFDLDTVIVSSRWQVWIWRDQQQLTLLLET